MPGIWSPAVSPLERVPVDVNASNVDQLQNLLLATAVLRARGLPFRESASLKMRPQCVAAFVRRARARQGHTAGHVIAGAQAVDSPSSVCRQRGRASVRQRGAKKAVEADPDEALRYHVEAETPVAVVRPPKHDVVLRHGDESMVGRRNPVGLPREKCQQVTGRFREFCEPPTRARDVNWG